MTTAPIKTATILGVEIHDVTLAEALERMKDMALSGEPHQVMTVNPEFVMLARKNRAFKRVLAEASLKTADGIGIVIGSRLLGSPLKERVAGVDLVERLASLAAEHRLAVFLLGAGPGIAERAAERLAGQNPGLRIVGTHSGSPHPDDEQGICRLIERTRPDILLVAYGAPQQDLWIARVQRRLRVPLAMGVGGTFDFIAGAVLRAPRPVQRVGLEWLFRLYKEPWRWKRMLVLPAFASHVLSEAVTGEVQKWFRTRERS